MSTFDANIFLTKNFKAKLLVKKIFTVVIFNYILRVAFTMIFFCKKKNSKTKLKVKNQKKPTSLQKKTARKMLVTLIREVYKCRNVEDF